MEILVKQDFPEGMDYLRPVGVDEYSLHVVSVFSEQAEQLTSGASVKVALNAEMQTVAVSVNQDSEFPYTGKTSSFHFIAV